MDPLLAMIGGLPSDQQQQQQVANRLRRNQDYGQLGMLTGDKVLAPFGKNMMGQTQDQALIVGRQRLADERQHALSKYYDAMNQRMGAQTELDQQKHAFAKLKQRQLMEEAERNRQHELEKARLENEAEDGGYGKLTNTEIRDMANIGSASNEIYRLRQMLNNEAFDPGNINYRSIPLPGARSAANLAGQYGIGTDDSKDVQDWWAQYNRLYTLPERNRLFGATLTTNEQQAWKDANLSPEMTKDQIIQKMDTMLQIYKRNMWRMQKGHVANNKNPDAVHSFMGLDAAWLNDGSYADETGEGIIIPITKSAEDYADLPEGVSVKVK